MTDLTMAYRLTTFDGLALPTALHQAALAVAATSGMVRTLDGRGFDAHGAAVAGVTFPYPLAYSCLATAATGAEMLAVLDALRGKVGVSGVLGLTLADASERWCTARLLALSFDASAVHRLHVPVSLTFEVASFWFGATHSGALTLQAGGGTVDYYATLECGGNVPVRDAVLTLTAGAAPITAATIALVQLSGMELTPVCEWEYTATIAAGASLVVDTGTWRVLNAGVDDYDHLHRTANHVSEYLFELQPNGATNIVALSLDGGGTPTLALAFTEQWI